MTDIRNYTTETKIEQIGIIPILLEVLARISLIDLIDTHYKSHGNWQGASKGLVTAVWICYIITKCDHRVSRVEDWVKQRELSINGYLSKWGYQIESKDFTDDRLDLLLEEYSQQDKWDKLECQINKKVIRVYDLKSKVIQLDATVGKSFKKVVQGGLFQYGNSKHFRSDLPQFKTMIANLEGIDLPLGAITVSGERSDDELYLPMIAVAKKSFARDGLLFEGDSKLSSLKNRTQISKQKDYYLCPLSKVQLSEKQLAKKYIQPVLKEAVKVESIKRKGNLIAVGYEVPKTCHNGSYSWSERQLVVRSENHTKAQKKSLDTRLAKAGRALTSLNDRKQGKKVFKKASDLRKACKVIELKYDVKGLLAIECRINYEKKKIRAYKDKPARIERKMNYSVIVTKKKQAIEEKKQLLGWRVYVTNQPKEELPLAKAINLYREEYRVERRIRNLKEEVTALLPLFLKKDNRITALINVLILVLKVISLIEFDIAKALKANNKELAGLYAGNSHISTATPTIGKIVEVFNELSVSHVKVKEIGSSFVLMPDLSTTQLDIIELLGFSPDIFYRLKKHKTILNST